VTPLAPALVLAASAVVVIDGEAALRHASALAALGPHPWGSPRSAAAAEYVAAKFREVGLQDVRMQAFEAGGLRGVNAFGALHGSGAEFIVVGGHHDSAPGAPAAYDDGGGIGVVIETARVLARRGARARTIVFASWDGEEAWSAGGGLTTTGSRAYVRSLGPEARNLVAAVDVEMCGWKGGYPVLHPIAYPEPLGPEAYVIAPGWLVSAALEGARGNDAALGVGDPVIPWLYQPATRTVRARLYGDDLSFLQSGLPAVFMSDSSFTAFYPWYHQPTDTPDKIDAASLARMGAAVLGIVQQLDGVRRGPASDPVWFAVAGRVAGGTLLRILGVLSVVPAIVMGFRLGGWTQTARLLHAGVFAFLLWRHPVPALWVFLLPNLAAGIRPRRWLLPVALLPLLALVVLGIVAWARGFVNGVWLDGTELLAAGAALVLLWTAARAPAARGSRPGRAARRAGPR
jgi:hypothetical protein